MELLAVDETLDSAQTAHIIQSYDKILKKAERLRAKSKSDEHLLESVFYVVHRSLKHYKTNANFSDIFLSGNYDCVTSTALYGLLLDSLDFRYDIIEFPFHTLLMVYLNDRTVLFDGTDPIGGFVTDNDQINERLMTYQTDAGQIDFQQENLKKINFKNLIGLQFYNLSVESFNRSDYSQSKELLKDAYFFYPSPRIKELSRYITLSE
ncbi:MAG: hypothetical protein RIA69_15025 [Cyclobacteriaceae bacterium]